MVGIIGAMEEEVSQLVKDMEVENRLQKGGMTFYQGNLYGRQCVVVQSGIGKVNAGICTQILVDMYDVHLVINTGIAGSMDSRIGVGDIVIGSEAMYHDVDASHFGYSLGEVPRLGKKIFYADEQLVQQACCICQKANPNIGVWQGRIVSGDQFVAEIEKKRKIQEIFSPMATEMEGAAIAHVAYLNQIAFLIVRGISDNADDKAQMDYPTFQAMAIENSIRFLREFLSQVEV